jgi:hypothetical protein
MIMVTTGAINVNEIPCQEALKKTMTIFSCLRSALCEKR